MGEYEEVMQAIFNQQNFLILITYAFYFVVLFFALGGIWVLIWYWTYKTKVWYYEPLGTDGLRKIGQDRAKFVKVKGTKDVFKLRLFWKRAKIEPPPAEVYLPTKKGKELHLITEGLFFNPLKLNTNPGFSTVPMNKLFWLAQTQKQAAQDYMKKGWWEKYGTLAITTLTVLLCLGAIIATLYYVHQIANNAISTYADAIRDTGKQLIRLPPGG